jgi:hypothetical protein
MGDEMFIVRDDAAELVSQQYRQVERLVYEAAIGPVWQAIAERDLQGDDLSLRGCCWWEVHGGCDRVDHLLGVWLLGHATADEADRQLLLSGAWGSNQRRLAVPVLAHGDPTVHRYMVRCGIQVGPAYAATPEDSYVTDLWVRRHGGIDLPTIITGARRLHTAGRGQRRRGG